MQLITVNEVVAAPKVYGFDNRFVCYCRGWQELREEEKVVVARDVRRAYGRAFGNLRVHFQGLDAFADFAAQGLAR
jgi:hypothetical protein